MNEKKKIENFYAKQINQTKAKFRELTEGILTKKHMKILIVEDNKEMMKRIVDQVKSMTKDRNTDKNIILAETLEQAQQAIQKNTDIELIITDVSYPEKEGMQQTPESGYSLIKYVKETKPEITIIAQSSDINYLERAKEIGADFIIKKIDLATILLEEKEENKAEKRILDQKRILIVTSFPEVGAAVKRAIQTFIEDSEIEICKWKEVDQKFSPGKYTHIIVFTSYLSDEDESVKTPKDQEEAKMLEAQGYKINSELHPIYLPHRYCWKDGDVKWILIPDEHQKNQEIGVYQKYQNEKKTVAYLPRIFELKDLLRLIKE